MSRFVTSIGSLLLIAAGAEEFGTHLGTRFWRLTSTL
jgi:hypothetical protein